MIPQEIDTLDTSQVSYAMVGIEFAQTSDKESAIQSRFDVKCDRSTTSFDLRPPLAELLTANKMKQSQFASAVANLQGIHQRAVTKINLSKNQTDFSSDYDGLPSKIAKATNLVSN